MLLTSYINVSDVFLNCVFTISMKAWCSGARGFLVDLLQTAVIQTAKPVKAVSFPFYATAVENYYCGMQPCTVKSPEIPLQG